MHIVITSGGIIILYSGIYTYMVQVYIVMNNNTQVIYSLIWAQVVLYTSYMVISESTYCMYMGQ